MFKKLILFLFLVLSALLIYAQESRLVGHRQILVYKVVAKTSAGTLKGVLQRVTQDQVTIVSDEKVDVIPVESIKTLKIKFDKKKEVQVFGKIAQAGIDVITDPQYTRPANSLGTDQYGNTILGDEKDTPLGDRVLVGSAMLAGALVGNELVKLVPPSTIETFRINYSREKYHTLYEDLAMYSIEMQSSPDYELVLLQKLQEAMMQNKVKP